jgi:hypothetical protein
MKEANLAYTVIGTAFGLISGILLFVITAQPQTELGSAADREAMRSPSSAYRFARAFAS